MTVAFHKPIGKKFNRPHTIHLFSSLHFRFSPLQPSSTKVEHIQYIFYVISGMTNFIEHKCLVKIFNTITPHTYLKEYLRLFPKSYLKKAAQHICIIDVTQRYFIHTDNMSHLLIQDCVGIFPLALVSTASSLRQSVVTVLVCV